MDVADPWAHLRNILGAKRGSLAELGVGPIVTAGFVCQAAAAAGWIDVDFGKREDRSLFSLAQKGELSASLRARVVEALLTALAVLALAIALVQSLVLVVAGTYGPVSSLGATTILLIVFQLVGTTAVVIALDEITSAGYAVGSGISNFIAGTTASNLVSSALSFSWESTIAGPQYQGSLIALCHAILKSHSKSRALRNVFYRDYLPNVWSLITTIGLFFAAVFVQSFRTEVALKNMRARGMRVNYPVKLLYTSSIPLIVTGSLASHLFLASHALYQLAPGNLVSRLITGAWRPLSEITHPSLQSACSGGLVSLLTPPHSLTAALLHPIQSATYASSLVAASALIAISWLVVSGSGPQELAKQFKEQQLVIAGHREGSMVRELKKVLPTAAASGAALLAALAVVGDVLGVYGGGVAFVATATTIYNCEPIN